MDVTDAAGATLFSLLFSAIGYRGSRLWLGWACSWLAALPDFLKQRR
jgi:hypothetical protein